MKTNIPKIKKTAHTANTKTGRGDFYGTAVKNPTGRAIDVFGMTTPKAKAKTPPRGLA